MPQLYRVDLLQRALASLCESLESARAAVIVSVEGFVIASYPPGDESFVENDAASSSHVAAMASIMVALAERTLSRLRLSDGEIDRLLVEGERGSLIVLPVSSEAAIAVLLEKEAKMGVALRTVPRAAQQVRDILERKAA
jgi:predicted regulator of Ras-like GTPase activity (Roadblock/LC7/MglB family)